MKSFLFLCGLVLLQANELYGAPCGNCSELEPVLDSNEDIEDFHLEGHRGSHSNLAWLVTPALFALGVMYVIYKCCRDGLCNCKRLRRRAAAMGEDSTSLAADHGYIPLSQVALFSSSQVPVTHPGVAGAQSSRRLLLVHNRTYCVTVDTVRGAEGASRRRILVQPLGPPSYEEALAQGSGGGDNPSLPAHPPTYTSAGPPCYRIAMGEITPAPSLEDHLALESVLSALENEPNDIPITFTSNRRRHRSAQDASVRRERHRNLSAQERRLWSRSEDAGEPLEMRPRCFSFSALKDAFRRSHMNMQDERESLLDASQHDDTADSLFMTMPPDETLSSMSSPGPTLRSLVVNSEMAKPHLPKIPRRAPQQVSFDVGILEDSAESSDSLNNRMATTNANTSAAIGAASFVHAQLRQRHSSAPESINAKQERSRHSSGNS